MTVIDDYDDDYDEVTHTVDGVELGTPFGDATVGYRAECECGWQGAWRDCVTVARRDGQIHSDESEQPADDLDTLVTGLLDLQDDLAAAVMWLAEYWSAHLPVPEALNGTAPASVRLMASCSTIDELAQAAAVLGVPVVDDTAPDSFGNRYRRAVRRFGQVQVEMLGPRSVEGVAA